MSALSDRVIVFGFTLNGWSLTQAGMPTQRHEETGSNRETSEEFRLSVIGRLKTSAVRFSWKLGLCKKSTYTFQAGVLDKRFAEGDRFPLKNHVSDVRYEWSIFGRAPGTSVSVMKCVDEWPAHGFLFFYFVTWRSTSANAASRSTRSLLASYWCCFSTFSGTQQT